MNMYFVIIPSQFKTMHGVFMYMQPATDGHASNDLVQ